MSFTMDLLVVTSSLGIQDEVNYIYTLKGNGFINHSEFVLTKGERSKLYASFRIFFFLRSLPLK